MTEKVSMQDKFIKFLQKNRIDFFRIGNAGFKSRVRSPYTYAYNEPFPCHKFWSDLILCFKGKTYMIEFGIKGANLERKAMQETRMIHWHDNGGIEWNLFHTWGECSAFLKSITGLQIM